MLSGPLKKFLLQLSTVFELKRKERATAEATARQPQVGDKRKRRQVQVEQQQAAAAAAAGEDSSSEDEES